MRAIALLQLAGVIAGAAGLAARRFTLPGRRSGPAPKSNGVDPTPCSIRVIGVGGAGCNAVDRMVLDQRGLENEVVEYWAVNTDAQSLAGAKADKKLQIGEELTRGLGAGGSPDTGRLAAEESRQAVREMVKGADMVFVTAGMGGGTGSGASPVIAREARLAGALTIAVVTIPFRFEGGQRGVQAEMAQRLLVEAADSVVTVTLSQTPSQTPNPNPHPAPRTPNPKVSNERLLRLVPEGTTADDAFLVADNVLRQSVAGTTDIVARPGLINVDFADVRAVLSSAGNCLVGVGAAKGPDRAEAAALQAVSCPLLDFRAFQRGKNRVGSRARSRTPATARPVSRATSDYDTKERVREATEAATQAAIKEAEEGGLGIIRGARGAVVNVVGGPDLSIDEVKKAGEVVRSACHKDANIIFGAVVHPRLEPGLLEPGEVKVTVLATGFDSKLLLSYRSRSWQVYKTVNKAFNSLALYMERRRRLTSVRRDEDQSMREFLKGSRNKKNSSEEKKGDSRWLRRRRNKDNTAAEGVAAPEEPEPQPEPLETTNAKV
mmetsp:Transcript_7145/g.20939  ORF Transcript_7145/g.20939 Transcript_7145/m.20939 type:complete len:548 (-) Transcript_7145:610-2253(-)|eukprot:CAMPEP_0118850794 /NCGR_PEP_ID=MMETSP1163-20130328/489_1 /TAXON_ID=124430 /ORGANISM="Phaeomonas parva, Strain CCMP2877" /LENGTH=547 /DNA_ID=CAMNT_0006783029 /DNA_START=207 /DNA_END=1850 /DNA_ORIENTATION=+